MKERPVKECQVCRVLDGHRPECAELHAENADLRRRLRLARKQVAIARRIGFDWSVFWMLDLRKPLSRRKR
jgi:hypothetical protein